MELLEQVGEWLNQGEGLVHSDDVPTHLNEEAAAVLNQKIDDHKAFFADLEHIREQGRTWTTMKRFRLLLNPDKIEI